MEIPTLQERQILAEAGWEWCCSDACPFGVEPPDGDGLFKAFHFETADDRASGTPDYMFDFAADRLAAAVTEAWDAERRGWSDPDLMLQADAEDVGGIMDMITGYQALDRLYLAVLHEG